MPRSYTYCVLVLSAVAAGRGASAALPPPRVPRIAGAWRDVTGLPDLGTYNKTGMQPVDFAVWQAADGTWQLLSCIRSTGIGGHTRLLYRWEAEDFFAPGLWRGAGIAMVGEDQYGEDIGGLQAPHVTRWGDPPVYHMFYGTWTAIAQATSVDGKNFTRVLDANGRSPIFHEGTAEGTLGFGNTRDPMLFAVDALPGVVNFHLIYSAYPAVMRNGTCPACDGKQSDGVWARTLSYGGTGHPAARLGSWNAWAETRGQMVGYGGSAGTGPGSSECPHIVYDDASGYWYLFRTQLYTPGGGQTSVYASRDPGHFGVGEGSDAYLVAQLPIAAPEVVRVGGKWYVFSLKEGLDGMRVAELQFA